MFFFSWIRAKVREAALAGLSDAASEIESPDGTASEAVAQLAARLRALPAPEEEPANGKRRVAAK